MSLNELQKKERSEYLERNLKITECSQGQSYAFISYASDNWERVFKDAVVPLQQTYGLCVYADKAFDKVNDKWIVPMLRNIRGADVIIVFVSQSYIESYACFLELLTAVNSKKPIVFVSLEDELRLGKTTDQPDVERGVKNEILNQGANIATNTNNTSNDLMRAMKSAYTSLSTLLEQDALSRYDISDAFINFFRDASVNRKTVNDLKAVKRTINSISKDVFDKAVIIRDELSAETAVQKTGMESRPREQASAAAEPASPESAQTQEPQEKSSVQEAAGEAVPQAVQETDGLETPQAGSAAAPAFSFNKPAKKSRINPVTIGIGVVAAVLIVLFLYMIPFGGLSRIRADKFYESGLLCLYGSEEQEVNFEQAQANFERALELGKEDAAFYLGGLYQWYNYPEYNYGKAREYFEANEENPYAKIALGLMYRNGASVEKDMDQAQELFDAAIDAGCVEGYYGSGVIAYGNKDYDTAEEYYNKVLEGQEQHYIAAAMNYLGILYASGNLGDSNYTKAREWYMQAAEKGYADAMRNLGLLYANGNGVEQDYAKAGEWYEKAAENGNADAMNNLGLLY